MAILVDWNKGTLRDDKGVQVDLKNIYGWNALRGGSQTPEQFRQSAFNAYLRASGRKRTTYEADVPGWSEAAGQFGNAPLSSWGAEWQKTPWQLKSAQGTSYSGTTGLSKPQSINQPAFGAAGYVGTDVGKGTYTIQPDLTKKYWTSGAGGIPAAANNALASAARTAVSSRAGQLNQIRSAVPVAADQGRTGWTPGGAGQVGAASNFQGFATQRNQGRVGISAASPVAAAIPVSTGAARALVRQRQNALAQAAAGAEAERASQAGVIGTQVDSSAPSGAIPSGAGSTSAVSGGATIATAGTVPLNQAKWDPYDPSTWEQDPYYNWTRQQTEKALRRSMQARGRSDSTQFDNALAQAMNELNAIESDKLYGRYRSEDEAQYQREMDLTRLGYSASSQQAQYTQQVGQLAAQFVDNYGNIDANSVQQYADWLASASATDAATRTALASQYTNQIMAMLLNYGQGVGQDYWQWANPAAQYSFAGGQNNALLASMLGKLLPYLIEFYQQSKNPVVNV